MIFSQKEILARTFLESALVKGWQTHTDEFNETKLELQTKYEKMPCSIQKAARKNTNQAEGPNEISYDSVLLHSPDFSVEAGDSIQVTYLNGKSRSFKAGEPYYFSSHHEVPLFREDEV